MSKLSRYKRKWFRATLRTFTVNYRHYTSQMRCTRAHDPSVLHTLHFKYAARGHVYNDVDETYSKVIWKAARKNERKYQKSMQYKNAKSRYNSIRNATSTYTYKIALADVNGNPVYE